MTKFCSWYWKSCPQISNDIRNFQPSGQLPTGLGLEVDKLILNFAPSLTETYLWIPEVSDNVVPGLDPMLTHIHSKYTTLAALQNIVTKNIYIYYYK